MYVEIARESNARLWRYLNSLASRLRIVDVIGVIETVVAVGPVVALTLRYHSMLITRDEIDFVEGFAQVGAGIEIGFGALRIPFVGGAVQDVASTTSAPLERVPDGRPQSGGSACTGSTLTP